jgi:hypothetical protein
MTELQFKTANELRARTMDRHTLKRNWSIKVAGLSPARKNGGTAITPGDLVARDKLRLKVFSRLRWRWKTVLLVKSRASDFGYQTPDELLTMDTAGALSLPILVETKMPAPFANSSFKGRKMRALSAGRLIYRRDSRADEAPNIFNPFWKTELVPVSSEPTARRIIPEIILKEVRH